IGQPFLSYVFFLALFSAGITSLIALAKFLYDNGNIYTLLTAFISSVILYFLPPVIIQFLDSVLVTSLFLITLPITVIVFLSLLRDKKN
ncbi:MAG: hypothetical protein QXS91_01535, partial [Candidatus Anstonellales archaeon]